MQVKAIPADLEKMIISKSNGVPAWIDQVLNELMRIGTLRMQEDSLLAKGKGSMVHAEKKFLKKLKKTLKKRLRRWAQEEGEGDDVVDIPDSTVAGSTAEADINPMNRVLVIKSDTDINKVKGN